MEAKSPRFSLGLKFFWGYLAFIGLEVILLFISVSNSPLGSGDVYGIIIMPILLGLDLLVLLVLIAIYFSVVSLKSKNIIVKVFSILVPIYILFSVYKFYDYHRSLPEPASGFLVPVKNPILEGFNAQLKYSSKAGYNIEYTYNGSLPFSFGEDKNLGYCKNIPNLTSSRYTTYTHFIFNGSDGVVYNTVNRNDFVLYYNDYGSCLTILTQNTDLKSSDDVIALLKTMQRKP